MASTTIANCYHSLQALFANPGEKYNRAIGFVAGKTFSCINGLKLEDHDSTLTKVGKVALSTLSLAAIVAAQVAATVLLAKVSPILAGGVIAIVAVIALSKLFGSPSEPPSPPPGPTPAPAAVAVATRSEEPNAALSVAADTATTVTDTVITTDAAATTDSGEAQTSTVVVTTEEAPTGATENASEEQVEVVSAELALPPVEGQNAATGTDAPSDSE